MHDASEDDPSGRARSAVYLTAEMLAPAIEAHAAALRSRIHFEPALKRLAQVQIDSFLGRPIVVRFTGTHSRFLTVAAFFILHFRAEEGDDCSGATLSRIMERLRLIGGVSRNTIAAQIKELEAYGWVETVRPDGDRRIRRVVPTEQMTPEMVKWFDAYLGALDVLDGGSGDLSEHDRESLCRTIARLGGDVLLDPASPWIAVPDGIGRVTARDGGFLLLLHLARAVAGLDRAEERPDRRICARGLKLDDVAEGLGVSRRHLRDMVVRSARLGHMGLIEGPHDHDVWISCDFRDQMWLWLSRQLAALDLVRTYVMAREGRG